MKYFDSEKRITREILRNKVPENVNLYHYTSAAGLLGILKSKKIWATSHKKLNDPIEIKYGRSVVREALLEYYQKKELNEYRRKAVSQALELAFNPNIYTSGETLHFIASLTEESDLLSQWIYYGDKGKGFALQVIFPQVDEIIAYCQPSQFAVVKIEYDKKKQRDICIHTMDDILEEGEKNAISDFDTILPFVRTLEAVAMSFKQDGFKEEKEWRIVSTIPTGFMEYNQGFTNFREHNGQIIQYKEIEIKEIQKIIAGPLQEFDCRDIWMLLVENGFKNIPPFEKSKIILRDMA